MAVHAAGKSTLLGTWAKPKRFDRNLVVIGAGAGGLVTSYIAAVLKAKVTLVEAHKMGGDCLNYGCVPSKALIRSARLVKQLRHADALGLRNGSATVDFGAVMARVRRVIRAIEPHDSAERFTQLGVDVMQGRARITSPWTVEVTTPAGTTTLATRSIVIATGARPVLPPIPGLQEVGCLTAETVWDLTELPRRLLVLGGGAVGCELAQAFSRLGAEVTIVESAPHILAREDAQAAALVADALRADGVELLTSHQARRCERAGDLRRIVVAQGDGNERSIEFDALLVAVGRQARVEGYGLEELGIALTPNRTIETNACLQTTVPNVFAVGDVAGPLQFTHFAAHQAWYAALNALFGRFWRFRADYAVVPSVTFTDPEIARVGLSEEEAKDQGVAFEVTRYGLDELDRAIVDEAASGFVKVLTAPGKDRILGVTIAGEHAGELIAEFVLAMKHGLGLNRILGTIHAYPTFAEANKYAAAQWRQAHVASGLLRWVERFHAWERT